MPSSELLYSFIIEKRKLKACVLFFLQEVTLKENESTVLRKQIEREFLEKVKLEDQIMEKMREQLTADKASQYTKKMTDKVRRRATELVSSDTLLKSFS